MITSNIRKHEILRSQKGISIIEFIIALVVVTIVIISFLQLTTSSVQTGTHVEKLSNVKDLAKTRVVELSKQAKVIFSQIPQGVDVIGSLTPSAPISSFSDYLDYQGNPISAQSASTTAIPRFIRQWLLVRNSPNNGDITIFCSVIYSDNNRILRIAKAVVTDSTTTVTTDTGTGSGPRH